MVEVFKTDVLHASDANMLLETIGKLFAGYEASFDLDDCDKILRIKCQSGTLQCQQLIDLIKALGFNAEILEY